jgi:hypothetical protein
MGNVVWPKQQHLFKPEFARPHHEKHQRHPQQGRCRQQHAFQAHAALNDIHIPYHFVGSFYLKR